MPNTRMVRARLLRRRWNLLHRYRGEVERVDEDLAPSVGDEIDLASDQWDAQVLMSLSDTDARALAEVVDAIRRIDQGCYGLCSSCGIKIERGRLEALPSTPLCIDCALDEERGFGTSHARIDAHG